MIVRLADLDADLDRMMPHAMAFARQSGLGQLLDCTENDMAAALRALDALPSCRMFVAEDDGEIAGGLGLIYAGAVWAPAKKVAEELFFWVASGAKPTAALMLIRAALDDVKAEGARMATFYSLKSSPAKLHRVYARLGMRPIQVAYVTKIEGVS